MAARLLLIAILVSTALTATSPLTQFHTVSVFFSDNGAQFYYRVLEVVSDASGAIVRYIRIAPHTLYCTRPLVQAREVRIPNQLPSQLIPQADLCAIDPAKFRSTVNAYSKFGAVEEAFSFGIVAQCGASTVALAIPHMQEPDLDRLHRDHPSLAPLWNIITEITTRAFGPDDLFHTADEKASLSLQETGARLLPDLVSGRFDLGLTLAASGDITNTGSPTFRQLLAGYQGPISPTAAKEAITPKLLNTEAWKFEKYSAPVYPPLALQARIQAQVELELTIDPATGNVAQVKPISGHPLLTDVAETAAKTWLFAPNSTPPTARLTLDFAIRCP